MKRNQLKILIRIFAVLLVVVVLMTLVGVLRNSGGNKYLLSTEEQKSITKIQIDSPEQTLILQSVDSQWKIMSSDPKTESFDADPDKVNNLLNLFSGGMILNTASTNPDNYSLFNVDDNGGVVVGLYSGDKKILALVIGKSTLTGNYIKLEADPNVYIINQSIGDTVSGSGDDFRKAQ